MRQALEEVYALSKARIKFSKSGMAKYISHLDLLRCFTRSIMRAELPVKYSQGFNPHQKITFSLPLSIGVTSECETVDIDFEDSVTYDDIKRLLDENLPPDIGVIDVHEIRGSANDIVSARYKVSLFSKTPFDKAYIREFFDKTNVTITKKTKKKGEVEVNLMDFVKGCEIDDETQENTIDGYLTEFYMTLSAGGQSNLKPEIAVEALLSDLRKKADVTSYDIHRTNIYVLKNDKLKDFE